jgi:hypothetical protein
LVGALLRPRLAARAVTSASVTAVESYFKTGPVAGWVGAVPVKTHWSAIIFEFMAAGAPRAVLDWPMCSCGSDPSEPLETF